MRVVFVPYGSKQRRGDPNDVVPPDRPEPKMKQCKDCLGEGDVFGVPCETCNGAGEVPDEEEPESMFDTKEEERGDR